MYACTHAWLRGAGAAKLHLCTGGQQRATVLQERSDRSVVQHLRTGGHRSPASDTADAQREAGAEADGQYGPSLSACGRSIPVKG